jgi:predicted MFS family arabinose efflux permease
VALPAGLRAFRHRDFRLFWTGQVVSLVGSWMQGLAQAWLVLELTDSPFLLGLVSALQFAPVLCLSLLAGVVADRLPRRAVVLGTQCALMLPAAALAVLVGTGHVRYWHVAALAAFIGVVNSLDMPARQAMVAELVGPDDLLNAVALNSAAFNGARIAGPALGGLLIGRYGLAVAFLLNSVSFLAPIAALLRQRPPPAPPREPARSLGRALREGLRHVQASPPIVTALATVTVVSVFTLNHSVQVPLFARDVLGQDAHGAGLLMAALGVGATAGAVAVAGLARPRASRAALLLPAAAVSAGLAALGAVRQPWVAAVVLFGIGAAQILLLTRCNTTVQLATPPSLRGRVMSLYATLFAGVSPFGAVLIGALAETLGAAAACAAAGALGLLGVGLVAVWTRGRPAA